MLNWPVMLACLQYIAACEAQGSVRKILNTNATNLRREQAEILAAHDVEVLVSVDGVGAVHDRQRRMAGGAGSFDRVAERLVMLLEAGCAVGLSVSVYHANLPHLTTLIDWVADLQEQFGVGIPVGFNELSIVDFPIAGDVAISGISNYLIGAIRHAEMRGVDVSGSSMLKPWNALLGRSEAGRYCSAIGNEVTVGPGGTISPCTPHRVRYGAIDDWDGALASDAFRSLASRVSGNLPECSGCEIEAYCGGGCSADEAAARSGAAVALSCNIRRSLFRSLVVSFAL